MENFRSLHFSLWIIERHLWQINALRMYYVVEADDHVVESVTGPRRRWIIHGGELCK